MLGHMDAERLLGLLAQEFIDTHNAGRIRILSDSQMAGDEGAGFLLQIDDYDVRLMVLDTPNGAPALGTDRLPVFVQLMEDNPSTVALILVWTTEDLLAIPLSMLRLRFLVQNPDRLPALLSEARSLPDVLRTVVERQVKLWEIGLDQAPLRTGESTDIQRLFKEAIGVAIEAECRRSYRHAERKLAAQHFPVEDEQQLIFMALEEALAGALAMDLVPWLTRVVQRGGR